MTTKKRITAAFLAACVIFLVLLSACAVVVEATHDCEGEDCDVCRLLDSIIGALRTVSLPAVVLTVAAITDTLRDVSRFSFGVRACHGTPVTEKVRLLN